MFIPHLELPPCPPTSPPPQTLYFSSPPLPQAPPQILPPPSPSSPAGLTEGEAGVAHIHFVGLDSDPLTGEVYAASIPVHKVSLSRFHTSQSPHFVAV